MSVGLERCFLFDAVEDSYPIAEVSGRIPETLRGTHYVNGPARFRRGDFQYKHWLDGDGMICALRFGPEGAHFTNRFIQTKKLLDEDAAGNFSIAASAPRSPETNCVARSCWSRPST